MGVNILIIILSLIPPILLGGFGLLFYLRKRPLESLVFLATSIHETILVAFPCIIAVVTNFKFEKVLRFPVYNVDVLKILFVENLYIGVFLLPFLLLRRKIPKVNPSSHSLYRFFALIVSIGIIVYSYQIIHRPSLKQIIESYSQSGLESANKFIAFFTLTFEHTSIIAAAILSIRSKQEAYPKIYQYMGYIMILLVLGLVIVSGVRGRIIWVSEFIFLVAIIKKRYKPLFLIGILMTALVPLSNILVQQIRPISEEIAKEGGLTGTALMNISSTIVKGVENPDKTGPGFIESLAERAQGPRNSIAFIREHDQGYRPGLNIYTGALLLFMPRVIIDRPVLGSPTQNFDDAAIFKVMQLNYADATFLTMGPVLASGHAYWEGGYLGVLILALLSSLIWITVIRFSYRLPVLLGILLCILSSCALLVDGFITMFTPLYAMVSLFWKNLLPLFLLFLVYAKIRLPKLVFFKSDRNKSFSSQGTTEIDEKNK